MSRRWKMLLLTFAAFAAAQSAVFSAGANDLIDIPAGTYSPVVRPAGDPETAIVPAFRLQRLPVTNGDYLEFVRANPKWQRSRVSKLFADASYLIHWTSDLEPGADAPLDAPVVAVSWFAARAYARWSGLRLPTTAEWERAAAAGYTTAEGKNEPEFMNDLYKWLARPTPRVHASTGQCRSNFFGVRGLHGAVWEWVDDFAKVLVTGESRADSALEKDLFCGGGSAGSRTPADYAAFMRMALRSSLNANNTTSSLGFRCAAEAREGNATSGTPEVSSL